MRFTPAQRRADWLEHANRDPLYRNLIRLKTRITTWRNKP